MVGDYKGISSAVWLFYFFGSDSGFSFFCAKLFFYNPESGPRATAVYEKDSRGGHRCVVKTYTHEAEERNKIKFLIRFKRVELKIYIFYFLSSVL